MYNIKLTVMHGTGRLKFVPAGPGAVDAVYIRNSYNKNKKEQCGSKRRYRSGSNNLDVDSTDDSEAREGEEWREVGRRAAVRLGPSFCTDPAVKEYVKHLKCSNRSRSNSCSDIKRSNGCDILENDWDIVDMTYTYRVESRVFSTYYDASSGGVAVPFLLRSLLRL